MRSYVTYRLLSALAVYLMITIRNVVYSVMNFWYSCKCVWLRRTGKLTISLNTRTFIRQ